MSVQPPTIDSVLFVGFGGPRSTGEVMPFLQNVVRGRGVSEERLQEVAHHYYEIGGRSPYNEITFRQAVALRRRLRERYARPLPVYAGMRNWHPMLEQVIGAMKHAGRRRTAGIILAAHRSSTSLERYMLDVRRAIEANGGGGPEMVYTGPFFDDPLFIQANVSRIESAAGLRRGRWPAELPLLFTAHSIPLSMAAGSSYVEDLLASCRAVAGILGVAAWQLVYQSRSGDPRTPWLEPDVNDAIRSLAAEGIRKIVAHPIGFLHDHVEVLFDLDVEAAATAAAEGVQWVRSGSVGDHAAFIDMLARRVLALTAPPPLDAEVRSAG